MMVITTSVYIYAGVFLSGLFLFMLFRFILSAKNKQKIKEYQGEISKSHSRILKLEVRNEKLQHRIAELESVLKSSHIQVPN